VKDLIVALAIILIVIGVSFGLAEMRPDRPATPSHPFSMAVGSQPVTNEKIVMRINGEAISETEFNALVRTAPEQMRPFYTTEAGRRSLAEQLVKLKTLEQEARKLGANEDADVMAQLDVDRANVLAAYTLRKLVGAPTEAEVRAEYARTKEAYASVPLSHILIAYQGGAVPARRGQAPPAPVAIQKAKQIVAKLRAGANFAQTALAESDDAESGERGGDLGPVSPEQLPQELAQVVMTLKPGDVSDPVQSKFGIHILRVSARQVQPIERVREQLAQKIQQQKLNATLERLQKGAKVDLDPKFFGATVLKPAPSPAQSRRPS